MREIVTIASMIEKEAANDTEQYTIASVIYNRLKKDWPLQIDSTTLYEYPDHEGAPTAEMLQTICAELGSNAGEKAVLSEVGYFLGRWIYIMDAADDLTDDLLQQKFNPFIQKLGLESSRGLHLLPEERKRADEECNAVLNGSLARLLPAVNLLPSGKFTRILENIFEKGLPEMQREILFLHIKKEKQHD